VLESLVAGRGIGSALLEHIETAARALGCFHISLVRTNDNVDAMRFFQRRGYRIASIDPGALNRARTTKPSIHLLGFPGIPIRHELTIMYT
jgi:ribosomal protein S18 acetylase RimI-like enzyme